MSTPGPVLMGVPFDSRGYDPDRLDRWAGLVAEATAAGNPVPGIRAGSVGHPCATCGVSVALGPGQQDLLRRQPMMVICMLCGLELAAAGYGPGDVVTVADVNAGRSTGE